MSRLATAMAAHRLLTEARSYITDRARWVKGSLVSGWDGALSEAPRVCSLGAIGRASGYPVDNWYDHPETRTACDILGKVMSGDEAGDSHEVADFNDAPETKHEDVLAAFDKAIERQCAVVRELAAQEAGESGKKDSTS